MSDDQHYYYLLDGKEHGPFSRSAIESLMSSEKLSPALIRLGTGGPWQVPVEVGIHPKEPIQTWLTPAESGLNSSTTPIRHMPIQVAPTSQEESDANEKRIAMQILIPGTFVVLAIVGYFIWKSVTPEPTAGVAPARSDIHVPAGNPEVDQDAAQDMSDGAIEILKQTLKSPSSFQLVSKKTLWMGTYKPASGQAKTASVVRIEYDSQNSFGAMLRGCAYVAFSADKSKYYFKDGSAVQSCTDALEDEQAVDFMRGMNFTD